MITAINKIFIYLGVSLIVLNILLLIYVKRDVFLEKYDVSYWKDRYEHSQYQLPISKRIIGDDGLYAYAGYRLVKGDNPFSINVDKPPVGKYLLGLSIVIFHNPLFYSLSLSIGILLSVYLISRYLFDDQLTAVFTTLVLSLDSLFLNNATSANLDVAYVFFLLMNILLLLIAQNNQKYKNILIVICGLFLGLFTETKPPILFPLIFMLDTIYILRLFDKKIIPVFILGIITGMLFPYVNYFHLGNNLIDYLKIHKYMYSIYSQSKLPIHHDALWRVIFTGKFPAIDSGKLSPVSEWSINWPFSLILFFLSLKRLFFNRSEKNFILKGMVIFITAAILFYSFIPSYPRYLSVVIPFIYILAIYYAKNFPKKYIYAVTVIIILYSFVNAFRFLSPNPNNLIQNFYYNYENFYFQDIYEQNLAKSHLPALNRNDFRNRIDSIYRQADIKKIILKPETIDFNQSEGTGKINFTVEYKNQLFGKFSQNKTVFLLKENGVWKIQFDWNIFLDSYLPQYSVSIADKNQEELPLIDSQGNIYLPTDQLYKISVDPEKISTSSEQEMLSYLSKISGKSVLQIQNTYLENVPSGQYASLFILKESSSSNKIEQGAINNNIRNNLSLYHGIKIEQLNIQLGDIILTDKEGNVISKTTVVGDMRNNYWYID
ncbi:hypothetical protein A2Y99_01500 [Candidatus Gottesmanbacteria bacterium RBG_13_37_7]|uniref:Glycosyltransferase RgtA/B/C/D-like domain-containing protein n=1 Tax=Candidatus Gottesmanbacteria bacterium RBG_13_37_7 TaxID=1798369 RepID=A0A1F5YIH4_9BACT|nr:MAG: hypothetical protein A2Y99_01500 [Candidatus Gottesmanbacteria bacterium RBG_13_37_7]